MRTQRLMTGNEALAYGALASGISLATGYPGSPATGTMSSLIDVAADLDLEVQWATNEKVAAEVAIGVSFSGRRALLCVKGVGMNVAIDPLMALAYTPLNGGFVIVLGDDPGAYGSQNDQDTREVARLLEMPILEPSSPNEAYQMIQIAFELSENYQIPIIIRITRSFANLQENVTQNGTSFSKKSKGFNRAPWRYTPVPANAVSKHTLLHRQLKKLQSSVEWTNFNRIKGVGDMGIIAVGMVYTKLIDVTGHQVFHKLLKLNALFPLPERKILEFVENCKEIIILEENEIFVENNIRSLIQRSEIPVRILGKLSGHVAREGELFRWQIQQSLQRFNPKIEIYHSYEFGNEHLERPPKTKNCADSGYERILRLLKKAGQELRMNPIIIGDPGCLVTVAEQLDAKYAMGSAVGISSGIAQMGTKERVVGIFGDGAFFHTAIPAICNAVYHQSQILLIILDNKTTRTSGFQPNPGVGRDAMGRKRPVLDIERILSACGIESIRSVSVECEDKELKKAFAEGLKSVGLEVIVLKW